MVNVINAANSVKDASGFCSLASMAC
jgi:hypothetical protein